MAMIRSSSEQRDWTNLPPDIVVAIGDAILAQDLLPCYISLRRVCSAWRNATENPATSSRRFRLHNWILIHPVPGLPESDRAIAASVSTIGSKTQTLCRLLNFSTSNRVLVDIPQLMGHYVRACVDGLLLVSKLGVDETKFADTNAPTRLLNPFTGAMIDYPALSQLFCEHRMFRQWPPGLLSIGFASSTASNLMVVTRTEVAYAVPGSTQWKLVANHYPRDAINVAHGFFRGCAYVFSVTLISLHVKLRLTQFKVEEGHPDQVKVGVERLMIPPSDMAEHIRLRIGRDIVFLVESDGELLLLSRSHKSRLSDFFFWVFKVVFEEGVSDNGRANLVPLNNIGKRALFINKSYGSICVSTDVYPSIEPNSIYCYHDSSLTIYHPRGSHREFLDARSPLTDYLYRPVKRSRFTKNPCPVFPDFGSRLGKRPRTGKK